MVSFADYSPLLDALGISYDELSEVGDSIFFYGDTAAIQELRDICYDLGLDYTGDLLDSQLVESAEFYAEQNEWEIWYDEDTSRWRTLDGKFAGDPYFFLKEDQLKYL